MIASNVTITSTATLIVASTHNATRTIYLEPVGNDIHIGGSAVTTSTGPNIPKDTITVIELPPLNALYGITATGTVNLRVMQPEGDF